MPHVVSLYYLGSPFFTTVCIIINLNLLKFMTSVYLVFGIHYYFVHNSRCIVLFSYRLVEYISIIG